MKAVVLHSGGLDSTVALYQAEARWPKKIAAISFNYGQRHHRELKAAKIICLDADITYTITEISSELRYQSRPTIAPFGGSSQTDQSIPVPEGHYADESMRATYVPNRNMIMLSIAASFALANGADTVIYAAHAGDHAIYPDCRPEFVREMNSTLQIANYKPVQILAPFITMSKAGIVKLGAELDVPFELTWSCYKGGEKHCGRCGTCVERREAFQLAGVADPTEYDV
jgi:7-cyano-7-deazaguanine synthase